jgi:hypothetical protein
MIAVVAPPAIFFGIWEPGGRHLPAVALAASLA